MNNTQAGSKRPNGKSAQMEKAPKWKNRSRKMEHPGMNNTQAGSKRLRQCFADLRARSRSALIPFITAGDPDRQTSLAILSRLPEWGADIVELGMPFSDPSADGPYIQRSCERALGQGIRVADILDMVKQFRRHNTDTPLVLMGYYSPVHFYGVEAFAKDAAAAGVDGMIMVDLPPEEDEPLYTALAQVGIDFIRFIAPTSDDKRIKTIVKRAGGFIYYISIAGITGTKQANTISMIMRMERLKSMTGDIPVAVGFGVSSPDQVHDMAQIADGVVVGSAIVRVIEEGVLNNHDQDMICDRMRAFVTSLASAVRT